MENKEFKWAEQEVKKQGNPVEGEIAIVNLPVKVYFEWSDKIVEDVDEFNNPVEFREGFIMKVIPQSFAYKGESRITEAYTTKEISNL